MEGQDVHLFVFDGLSDWEAGYAVAGINHPQFQRQPGRYRVRTVAPHKGCVVTMGGIRIQPDLTLDALWPANSAMLILARGGLLDDRRHTSNAPEYLAATRYLSLIHISEPTRPY